MSQKGRNNISLIGTVEFSIIGVKNLQNQLLASYLGKETCKKCKIFKKISYLPIYHENSRIVILDYQTLDIDQMMMELKVYNTRKQRNNHIILYNVPTDIPLQRELITQGIRGVFYEHDSTDNLTKGILSVIQGRLWLSREMMSKCILESSQKNFPVKSIVDKLSPRQVEILSMIAIGASNQDISDQLFISPHTVKNHLYNIFKKIDVSNRMQASLWAATHL